MKAHNFKYISEDNKKYFITIEYKENILINFEEEQTKTKFKTKYGLVFINERFGKKFHFKNISQFYDCLNNNISKRKLIINPPYKNIINTIWKIYPKDSSKKETFTLILNKVFNKKLSLIFLSDYNKYENIVKKIISHGKLQLQSKKKINKDFYELTCKNSFMLENFIFFEKNENNIEDKIQILNDLIEENKELKKKEFRTVFVLFDEPNLEDTIMELVNEFYSEQIFIIVIYSKIVSELKSELQFRIEKLTEIKKTFFDINNIYILGISELDKICIPILKIYNYFNQMGDGFYKEFSSNSEYQIYGFEEEFDNIMKTHYFNILLCGLTGSGKSTFINTIMDEKKAFIQSGVSSGTYRNNYYIHKDYPIKIIDVCGFADGSEGKTNSEQLSAIYKKNNNNILIDENINDIFTFYGDKRNNIHLLIYINVYNTKYDVIPGELPVVKQAKDLNIPILFVVNKCDDKLFTDKEEMKDFKKLVEKSKKKTCYEKSQTLCINCLTKNGFEELLETIYQNYNKYKIEEPILFKLKENSINEEELKGAFNKNIFFGDPDPNEFLFNDSLITSVLDIKNLIVKLAGYYYNRLKFSSSISFFFSRLYNSMHKDENSNNFPLLTDLVQKIYKNFKMEKTQEQCNNFIKKYIIDYFKLKVQNKKEIEEKVDAYDDCGNRINNCRNQFKDEFDRAKFVKDYSLLGKMFWNSELNFKIKENIETDWLISENNEENNSKKNKKQLSEEIFAEEDYGKIETEKLLKYIKKDFGLVKNAEELSLKQKMMVKLFYISYISNELINSIYGQINQKGFEYKSICDLYYNVSKSYNSAIDGIKKIEEKMKKDKKNKNYYAFLKSQGIGNPPNTIIIGKTKD